MKLANACCLPVKYPYLASQSTVAAPALEGWHRHKLRAIAVALAAASNVQAADNSMHPTTPRSAAALTASAQIGNVEKTLDLVRDVYSGGYQTHLSPGPLSHWLQPFNEKREAIEQQHGLSFGFQFAPIYNFGTHSSPDNKTANSAVDIALRWDGAIERDGYKGSLDVFFYRRQDDLLATDTSAFNTARGTIMGAADSNVGGSLNSLSNLSWESLIFDGVLDVSLGQLFLPAMFDENDILGNDRLSFMAEPLANNPARVLPEADTGMGVGMWVTPSEHFYVGGIVAQANADGKYPDFDAFDGDWAHMAEVGWTPHFASVGSGKYRLSYSTVDLSTEQKGAPGNSDGWNISIEQELGDSVVIAARAGSNDGNRNDIKRMVSSGIVFEHVFGYELDMIGIGAFWAEPKDPARRDEYGTELFWRLQLTNSLQLTPGIQLWRPSDPARNNAEAVFNIRLMISI